MTGSYRTALVDWLACAVAGRGQPAARAARALDDEVIALGTAGHVLDFDDTYAPGLAHLSACTAPAALVVAASLDASVGDALAAYAAGFEVMGALSAANHPGLRERGWHPTAVCGAVGAAVAAARLLEANEVYAAELAVVQASGLNAAFGGDGKSLQVGLAAAAGVRAARLEAAGARAGAGVVAGFEAAYGACWTLADGRRAVDENWIKAYPCCLQTHSAIEAAVALGGGVPDGEIVAVVHPVSRLTAFRDDVATGLEAKFSIPYLVAYTLLRGAPAVASFAAVDREARVLAAERVRVRVDASLLESEAVLIAGGHEVARIPAALGSPARPMDDAALAAKVRDLTGDRLDGLLDDATAPARRVLDAAFG